MLDQARLLVQPESPIATGVRVELLVLERDAERYLDSLRLRTRWERDLADGQVAEHVLVVEDCAVHYCVLTFLAKAAPGIACHIVAEAFTSDVNVCTLLPRSCVWIESFDTVRRQGIAAVCP